MKKDKILKNKIELVTIGCYSLGLLLTCLTKCPIFMLLTILAFPISLKFIKFHPCFIL